MNPPASLAVEQTNQTVETASRPRCLRIQGRETPGRIPEGARVVHRGGARAAVWSPRASTRATSAGTRDRRSRSQSERIPFLSDEAVRKKERNTFIYAQKTDR